MIPLDSLFAAIGHTLWAVSWQIAVLIAFIGVLSLFFRKASSSFRYFLWCIVLVRLCIPMELKLPFGASDMVPPLNDIVFLSPENLHDLFPVSIQSGGISTMGAPEIIALFWLGILALILCLIIARFIQIRKMLAFCSPVVRPDLCNLLQRIRRELGMKQSVRLLTTDDDTIQTPLVAGVFRPVILFPRRIAESWSCDDLEPVLLHELLHIQRYDPLINRLQMILQALYFFHPLVWYANRQIRKIREEVCDDLAIHRLRDDRKQYSLSILRIMEEALREPVWGWGGIGFSEKRSTLKERIKRIMDTHYPSWKPMTIGSIVLLGGIVIVGFALSCGKKIDTITSNVSVEKTTVQPQKNKRSDIHITLLENGEYDIAGTHATDETIEQVLKTVLGKYPDNYRRVFISGTPKNMSQLNRAQTIAHKLHAAVTAKVGKNQTITSGEKIVATAQTTDPRVIIAGLQQVLKSADVPLTDEQQKRIMEVFDPASPDDMRPVYEVFSKEQKQVLVNILRKQLANSAYPLTKSQESRIMALGLGSKDKSEADIVTPEQAQISIQSEMKSRQNTTEKKSEQPQKNKKSDIQITLLGNSEYDIEGTHATDETIKQVLETIIDKSPVNNRHVNISGTLKSSEDLFKVENIIGKLNVKGISVDPEVMKQLHLAKPITMDETSFIYVNIIKKGEYEVDGKKAKDENFLQVLKQELAKNTGRRVTFVSSTGATIDNIYELRDLAEKNGIHISVCIDSTYPIPK